MKDAIKAGMVRLRRWCKARNGWGRQRQLAKELGVSEPLVSSWVMCRRLPKPDDWERIKAIMEREIPKKGKTLMQLAKEGKL